MGKISVLKILLVLTLFALFASGTAQAQQFEPPGANPVKKEQIEGVRELSGNAPSLMNVHLRRDGKKLKLHFLLTAPVATEVVENVNKFVIVVKFPGTFSALPNGKRELHFNDPYVMGIQFVNLKGTDLWAKIRLRSPDLEGAVESPRNDREVVVGLTPVPPSNRATLVGVKLVKSRHTSKVVLDVTKIPEYDVEVRGNQYLIRLLNTRFRVSTTPKDKDKRISIGSIEERGKDLQAQIVMARADLLVEPLVVQDPPQLVFNFSLPAIQPDKQKETALKTPAKKIKKASRVESVGLLLEGVSPEARANYILAEREFRERKYHTALMLFQKIFKAMPRKKLGIRALFRAADTQNKIWSALKIKNLHPLIADYQHAIRAADQIQYDSDQIPGAFFQIGRAYQKMGFNHEALVHYQILQERFPQNYPYTPDAFFFQGKANLSMGQYEDAVTAFREFQARDGDPRNEAASYYHIGEGFYNLGRVVEAKREFDQGRRLNVDFPEKFPLLLFNMGETYYENADFDIARVVYNQLLDRFPEKNYAKLVGLRMGDFLREEGKEEDALVQYEAVIKNAPLNVGLRGRMRVANILAKRPLGDHYKRAIKLYDQVIKSDQETLVVQEAFLLKGLTQTLHKMNVEAIGTFQALIKKFPESPYIKRDLVAPNIVENLKSLVDDLSRKKDFWGVVRVYARYRDPYFADFRFPVSLFQVAQAYQVLGLYDEALGLYDYIDRRGEVPMTPLVAYQRAVAFQLKDDLGEAEEQLLKFIQNHPKSNYIVDARLRLGIVYMEGRRYADALNALKIMLQDYEKTGDAQLGESISEAYYYLGMIHKEMGQFKESVDGFRAVTDNFHNPIVGDLVPEYVILSQFGVGDALFELGQDKEAVGVFQQAINRYPSHEKAPWARFQIGLIYRRGGEERKALETFNSLVELAKTRPGELWETLARENQRDLVNSLGFKDYLKQ